VLRQVDPNRGPGGRQHVSDLYSPEGYSYDDEFYGPGPVATSLKAFNGDLSAWSTPSAVDMSKMFKSAKVFENGGQPLALDTSSVTDMSYMFEVTEVFNQPLTLDTSSVTDMSYMFYYTPRPSTSLSRSTPAAFHRWSACFSKRLPASRSESIRRASPA
jgi:hypothetical protein